MTKHVPMEELEQFKRFVSVSHNVWSILDKWRPFAKDTVGKQFVRAVDSIGANLVEGDGRHSTKDGLHFFRIARGSARETRYWINCAAARNLIEHSVADQLIADLIASTKQLNALIDYRFSKHCAIHVAETAIRTYAALPAESDDDPFSSPLWESAYLGVVGP